MVNTGLGAYITLIEIIVERVSELKKLIIKHFILKKVKTKEKNKPMTPLVEDMNFFIVIDMLNRILNQISRYLKLKKYFRIELSILYRNKPSFLVTLLQIVAVQNHWSIPHPQLKLQG